MIQIFTYPQTRGVRAVWACNELGLEYDYKVVNLYKGEHKSPDYLKMTPTGKVPAIVDGDITIAESGAIVTYLADKVGKLIPDSGTQARAYFEEMMFFVLTELEQPLWTQAKHKFALPEDKRIPEAIELGEWEFQQALNVFSKMLGDRSYVAGNEFTVADIVAAHTLSWAQGFKQNIDIENVQAYASKVLARKSLKDARALEKKYLDALQG